MYRREGDESQANRAPPEGAAGHDSKNGERRNGLLLVAQARVSRPAPRPLRACGTKPDKGSPIPFLAPHDKASHAPHDNGIPLSFSFVFDTIWFSI